MWPELYGFYFNVILNKSHEWGVSPWHWYLTSALPKSITCSIPFIIIGLFYQRRGHLIDTNLIQILTPAFIYVALFSFLPHKELRFIMPSLTLINIGGAYGMSKM